LKTTEKVEGKAVRQVNNHIYSSKRLIGPTMGVQSEEKEKYKSRAEIKLGLAKEISKMSLLEY